MKVRQGKGDFSGTVPLPHASGLAGAISASWKRRRDDDRPAVGKQADAQPFCRQGNGRGFRGGRQGAASRAVEAGRRRNGKRAADAHLELINAAEAAGYKLYYEKNPDGSICYIIGITKEIRQKIQKNDKDFVHITIQERDR